AASRRGPPRARPAGPGNTRTPAGAPPPPPQNPPRGCFVPGTQTQPPSAPAMPGGNAMFGPSWPFHVFAQMEKTPLANLLITDLQGGTSNSDILESNPADNMDGNPTRRPDIQFQIWMRNMMV